MNIEKLKEVQQQFTEIQSKISETVSSQNHEVTVTINGKIQIVELKIKESLQTSIAETLIKEIINKAIRNVSEKLTSTMSLLQQHNYKI